MLVQSIITAVLLLSSAYALANANIDFLRDLEANYQRIAQDNPNNRHLPKMRREIIKLRQSLGLAIDCASFLEAEGNYSTDNFGLLYSLAQTGEFHGSEVVNNLRKVIPTQKFGYFQQERDYPSGLLGSPMPLVRKSDKVNGISFSFAGGFFRSVRMQIKWWEGNKLFHELDIFNFEKGNGTTMEVAEVSTGFVVNISGMEDRRFGKRYEILIGLDFNGDLKSIEISYSERGKRWYSDSKVLPEENSSSKVLIRKR